MAADQKMLQWSYLPKEGPDKDACNYKVDQCTNGKWILVMGVMDPNASVPVYG
jgi:hypothetical protein